MPQPWTAVQLERLAYLWRSRVPAIDIAAELATSRNAIWCKLKRIRRNHEHASRFAPRKRPAQLRKVLRDDRRMQTLGEQLTTEVIDEFVALALEGPIQAWTEAEVQELVTGRERGDSMQVIAQRLGRSRNAVVGQANRQGLCEPKGPPPSPPKQWHYARIRMHGQCRWPIGDPKAEDFHFCGDDSPVDKPYCPKHHRAAFTKPNFKAELRDAAE